MYRSIIVEKINSSNISLSELSSKFNVDQNQFHNFINSKIELELDFEIMLQLVQDVVPEKEFEVMQHYIESLKSVKNLICALEYSSNNRLFDTLSFLMDKLKGSSIEELNGWCFLYQCFYNYQNNQQDNVLEMVENFHAVTKEMMIFKKIIILYMYHYNFKKYRYSLTLAKECFEDLYFISDSFLKKSFRSRINYVLAYTHLIVLGNLNEAREHAIKLLDETFYRVFQINALCWLGTSYYFEDYFTSLDYFTKAKKMSSLVNYNGISIDSNILFLNNFWGKQKEIPIDNKAEIAHYLIKNGAIKEGIKILDDLSETPFRLYYRYLATKDPTYLVKSKEQFAKNKYTFYVRELIEPELIRAGYQLIAN